MLLTLKLQHMHKVMELSRLGKAVSQQIDKHARVNEGDADDDAAGSSICSTAHVLSCDVSSASAEASMALTRLD